MFPVPSTALDVMKGHTNGHCGGVMVLNASHHDFVTHSIALCKNWPEQKTGQSTFDFHAKFTKAIALRAISWMAPRTSTLQRCWGAFSCRTAPNLRFLLLLLAWTRSSIYQHPDVSR
jgi:hypothetical protein